jgi:hypothetical protein
MFNWQPANATGRSSSLDGWLAAIASRAPTTAKHLATIASHLATTASHLVIAARHPSIIATQPAVIARHTRTRLVITQCWLDAYRTPRITHKTITNHEERTLTYDCFLMPAHRRCRQSRFSRPSIFLFTPLCGVKRKYCGSLARPMSSILVHGSTC